MKITPTNMTRTFTRPSSLPMRPRLLPLLLAACLGATGVATATPMNPTVVNGQVTFSQNGNVFSITNSPNAIINWSSFSIAQGEIVRFLQQSSNSAVLNRITGQDPSRIMGALQSNGHVYLINPNGILFGAGAQVNVAGLLASTLDIANADFLAGKNKFLAGANAASVVNEGAITTPSGGKVFLIAPDVTNSGIITSPQGEVVLAAGHSVQLADSSNPGMHVVVSAPENQAINIGEVIAQGGRIGIYGALVNQRGTLNANSAVIGENGKIILKSTRKTLLEAGSVTTATGVDIGGEVQVLGEQVGLMGDARVDVRGQNGGGTALIGGDYQGKNAAVMNAQQVFVGKDAKISADAIVSGNGGKVIVWGDQSAQAFGTISARGGTLSGNGGFVETSGHFLDVAGIRVDAGAPKGKNGQWLLDPYNINVSMGDSVQLSDVAAFANPTPNGSDTSFVNGSLISAATADVTLQARNDITFSAEINITAEGVGLTAQAGNNINVYGPITTHGGSLLLSANDNSGGTATGTGKVVMSGGPLITNGGTLTVRDSTTNPTFPPSSPVGQAINSTVNIINAATNNVNPGSPPAFVASPPSSTGSTSSSSSSGTTGSTGSAATTSAADDGKAADTKKDDKKSDTKEVASNDKSGTKNEPAKKMYCN